MQANNYEYGNMMKVQPNCMQFMHYWESMRPKNIGNSCI